ncbi:hypothetical protein EZS27_010948 [termite gut metagenome]|uniref:Uncharacterized protein n=1 Tax=termite gut metagenome TaxID=433724 RepID=A0A5J4S785_9ZZZZ
MGLMVYSLSNIPCSANRDYFIYLLDYGWDEPIAKALRENFDKMATIAASNKAVVIKGTELSHFENEVFSWHSINNENSEGLLPALLITNTHPQYFMENNQSFSGRKNILRVNNEYDSMKLILIPFKKFCDTATDVIALINKVFQDITNQKDLSDFQIAKEMKKGVKGSIVDSIILEPNISGIGIKLDFIKKYFNK